MRERRRTFGPVVLVGLASAALAAVAAARPWLRVQGDSTTGDASSPLGSDLSLTAAQESPLAAALALVVLACWGVVLVTRSWFRRAVAFLGVSAAAGLAGSAISAPWLLREGVTTRLPQVAEGQATTELTGWWWTSLLASVLVVATTVAAALLVPHWPEMGTRYDAPTEAGGGPDETSSIDLWKALDEGRDPTRDTTT